MNLKAYREYIKENPKEFWFKSRWYGWGWVPAKWPGWATLAIWFLSLLILAFTVIADENAATGETLLTFLFLVVLLTAALIGICWKKGERPRWYWGDPRAKR